MLSLLILTGIVVIGLLVALRGTVARPKAVLVSVIYLLTTSFTIVGNPFAEHKAVTIPIYGIILGLPWSLVAMKYVHSHANFTLEACAVLNAVILFAVLGKR